MNMIEAIEDENLFSPFLGNDLESWEVWMAALCTLYGLPVPKWYWNLVRECTGRKLELLPHAGFNRALFLVGRRSGKSRIAALIGAFEAAFAGHDSKLAKGERGVVPICAPTKWQAKIVKNYVRAVFEGPILQNEVSAETKEGFELTNGISIEILAGDWRTIRGPTLIAAVVDEAAFFGYDTESKVRSDTELIRAMRPGLATVGGKLICISSPYARKGWCFDQHRMHFDNDTAKVLVWNCPSRTMNPTLPQSVVDEALEEDRQAAISEYMGEFRDDVSEYLPRSVIEAVVVPGRKELFPRGSIQYHAFVDLSGGRVEDAAVAVAHKEGRKVVVDLAKRYKAPFNPHEVVASIAGELRRYRVQRVAGDNYAADFVAQAFGSHGFRYKRSEKPKAGLYAEFLPRVCSGDIELLNDEVLVNQLAALERRTRSGGKDIIDHPKGGKDDLANAVAGVADVAFQRRIVVGALRKRPDLIMENV